MSWTAEELARDSGAEILSDPGGAATGFAIDSREVEAGDLFIGIPGERVDGGNFAAGVIEAGAWGALVTPAAAEAIGDPGGVVLVHPDPVRALGSLAGAHRASLECPVIGVTGSSGKTSTKDILASLLATEGETLASRGNRNTEIGMPLEILRAGPETRFLVLEMAMRGRGQIERLAEIAKPDLGVIVSIGPAHLDLLGSIEAIAAAKSELIEGLAPGSVAVIPSDEPLLDPHRRDDLKMVTFGPGGDVELLEADGRLLTISAFGTGHKVSVNFDQPHNRVNLLASIAAAEAVGVRPPSDLGVAFSALRGERIGLQDGVLVINDCYNANPSSVSAALDDLAEESARRGGRSVAVLGDMLELGPQERDFHVATGRDARQHGVGLLVTVGPLAKAMVDGFDGESVSVSTARDAADAVPGLLEEGDTVLVKGSRGVGLDLLTERLREQG